MRHGTNPDSAVMSHISTNIDMKTQEAVNPRVCHSRSSHRNQTKDVKELVLLKGLIIVDIEMFAVKSCKSPVYSRWNDWQSIVIETEYGYAWMDKAAENKSVSGDVRRHAQNEGK